MSELPVTVQAIHPAGKFRAAHVDLRYDPQHAAPRRYRVHFDSEGKATQITEMRSLYTGDETAAVWPLGCLSPRSALRRMCQLAETEHAKQ